MLFLLFGEQFLIKAQCTEFAYAVALPVDDDDQNKEEVIKAKERAILTLGETLSKYGFVEGKNNNMLKIDVLITKCCECTELGELIQTTRGIIDIFSKAKAAKIIRELVDRFLDMNKTIGNEVCCICMRDDHFRVCLSV